MTHDDDQLILVVRGVTAKYLISSLTDTIFEFIVNG